MYLNCFLLIVFVSLTNEIKSSITKTLKSSPRLNGTSFTFSTTDLSKSNEFGFPNKGLNEFDSDVHAHYLSDLTQDKPFVRCSKPNDGDSLWKYSIPYLNKSEGLLRFREYRGKPILLVNVATFCESTIEYPMYNELKDRYGDDLIIVGFPCNQFLNQEPTEDATEIFNAIKYVRPGNGFVPKFPLTELIKVNGDDQHPIYSFLKRCCPSTRVRFNAKEHYLLYSPKNSRDIRWNFEKFLIDPETGHPIKRYDQKYLPNRLFEDIDEVLARTSKQQFTTNP
ncbi:Glutathione peroxidase 6 [Sarcoptes scabiei]|uniref:Glutathione peroxidase n=1 Tax=Sarcoptes scabiei TaxID=52283 RepID=A0A834VHV2_SARSC|nr:Glutathione peroxidase 6 [Sarcoptes scabiei]